MPPDVVRAIIVDLRADPELQADIEKLREKAEAGTLTKEKQAACRDQVEVIGVVSIIQSKARQVLARRAP